MAVKASGALRVGRLGVFCGLLCAVVLKSYATVDYRADAGVTAEKTVQDVVVQGVYVDELALESTVLNAGLESAAMADDIEVANAAIEEANAAAIEEAKLVAVPLPAAAWLFGSALVGFIMLSNRRSI